MNYNINIMSQVLPWMREKIVVMKGRVEKEIKRIMKKEEMNYENKNLFNNVPEPILAHILGYIRLVPRFRDKRVWVCKRFSKCIMYIPHVFMDGVDCEKRIAYMRLINAISVKRVDMLCCEYVNIDDMMMLSRMKNIEMLTITNCSMTDDMMRIIGGLENLRVLNLSGCKVTDEGIGWLSKCDKLEELDCSFTHKWNMNEGISGTTFAILNGLRRLNVINCRNIGADSLMIRKLIGLEMLQISCYEKVDLGELVNLRSLDIRCNKMMKIYGLNKIINLEELRVCNCHLILSEKGDLNLRKLYMCDCWFDVESWEMISRCINLKKLQLYKCKGNPSLTNHVLCNIVHALENLVTLHIIDCGIKHFYCLGKIEAKKLEVLTLDFKAYKPHKPYDPYVPCPSSQPFYQHTPSRPYRWIY